MSTTCSSNSRVHILIKYVMIIIMLFIWYHKHRHLYKKKSHKMDWLIMVDRATLFFKTDAVSIYYKSRGAQMPHTREDHWSIEKKAVELSSRSRARGWAPDPVRNHTWRRNVLCAHAFAMRICSTRRNHGTTTRSKPAARAQLIPVTTQRVGLG